jgi:hypothetical protein
MDVAGDDWAEEWGDDDAAAAWEEDAADWDWEAAADQDWEAAEVADVAMDEGCHWCGRPVWFAGYPLCEGCDEANYRDLLREVRRERGDEDDATTASGDPPEEFTDVESSEDEAGR